MVIEETRQFDRIVRGVYELTAKEVYGTENPEGLAVFAYGSPGRIELIGGDSDADLLLVEEERNSKTEQFRKSFKDELGRFDFSKVDLTSWGTYNEIETYLKKSLVEGNQVLEARYLIGNKKVKNEIERKKRKYNSIERGLENIIFNRLYFNQYFRQRIRDGAINIKYCPGGSRDFLFVGWYDKLSRMISGEKQENSYQPRIKVGVKRLFEQEKITKSELVTSLEAISFSMMFRSNVLRVNKNTSDKGLTFIDELTLQRLQEVGYPKPDITKKTFEQYRKSIDKISYIIWNETIKKSGLIMSQRWENRFREAVSLETSPSERSKMSSEDSLIRIGLIWGASEADEEQLLKSLATKHKDTDNWATIGSLACSPYCPPEILHHFGAGIAKEDGYGYLLRIIARNKNTEKETLENIARDSSLEKRYTEVAEAALIGGNKHANNQI
ncbi:MAG: hypothetical protein AABW50_05555 [Nanoarchaeota archaeon]